VKLFSAHQNRGLRTGRTSIVPFFLGLAFDGATAVRGWPSPRSTYGDPERPSNLETE